MALNSNQALAAAGMIIAGILTAAANVGAFSGTNDAAAPTTIAAVATPQVVNTTAATPVVGPDDLQVVVDSIAPSVADADVSGSTTYRVGGAGSVTVERADAGLVITDLSPSPGWTAAGPDDGVATSVYAVFSDGATAIEVRINDVDGALVPTVGASTAGP